MYARLYTTIYLSYLEENRPNVAALVEHGRELPPLEGTTRTVEHVHRVVVGGSVSIVPTDQVHLVTTCFLFISYLQGVSIEMEFIIVEFSAYDQCTLTIE